MRLERLKKIKENLSEIGKISLVLCYDDNDGVSGHAKKINNLTQDIYKDIDKEESLVRFVDEEEEKLKQKYPDYDPKDIKTVNKGASSYVQWLETGNHPVSNTNPNLKWGDYHL